MKKTSKNNFVLIMIIYLAGIFMGAIDTGIVTPARTIIQNNLMVNDKTGIWMITIYTLAYAASIPVMGKLADKYGRKYIYLTSIFLFGLGSLFCGLSEHFGSFTVLLAARVVQAIGGGGIMPVATAEFGTTFPAEKRGMALGLVGGVYGVANIVGSSAGSAILDIFGKNNWQYIFYINLPITVFIIAAGLITLPNNKEKDVKKIDIWGILLVTSMVLSLLYGLKQIDFFDFSNTVVSTDVYPFLLIFIVLLPIFIFVEKRAEDPVMNLSYFTNPQIIITLLVSFTVGMVMMGMIFVPQFSENALKISSGNGGYFVVILGLFAGASSPFSGKMIDKLGAKAVLSIGFFIAIIGSLFLIFVTTNHPSTLTVIINLVIIGTGMGFTMGAPLNYMMLSNTKEEESNSALATLSLVRSIGTAIAPAIMVGFISHAGALIQGNVMELLPKEVSVPPLPYAQELTTKMQQLKSDPNMKDKLANVNIPDLTSMNKVEINMNSSSGYKMPSDLLELMKSSDVTNITERTKILAGRMFDEMTPKITSDIENGIQKGIDGMTDSISEMEKSQAQMQSACDGMSKGITGMQSAVKQQKQALAQLNGLYASMQKSMMSSAIPSKSAAGSSSTQGMPASAMQGSTMPANISSSMPSAMPSGQAASNPAAGAAPAGMTMGAAGKPVSIIDMIPAQVRNKIPSNVLAQLKDVKTPQDLKKKITELEKAISTLEAKISETSKSQEKMKTAISSIQAAREDMKDTINKMTTLKSAVPGAFTTAKNNYIAQIDQNSDKLEKTYQSTLNTGFKQIYMTSAISALIALVILFLYKDKRNAKNTLSQSAA